MNTTNTRIINMENIQSTRTEAALKTTNIQTFKSRL